MYLVCMGFVQKLIHNYLSWFLFQEGKISRMVSILTCHLRCIDHSRNVFVLSQPNPFFESDGVHNYQLKRVMNTYQDIYSMVGGTSLSIKTLNKDINRGQRCMRILKFG